MTHIIFSYDRWFRVIYFCGTYDDIGIDEHGDPLISIIWKWTHNINTARILNSTDAWDLVRMGLKEGMTLHLQRKEQHESQKNILYHFRRIKSH